MNDALLGRRLGEFVIRERVGEGAFGQVFRADQPILQREAVVKIAHTSDGSTVERVLREARLASRIDHPFAAHVYGFGAEPDGVLWIAMELVRGTPLDRVLAEAGAMPLERALPLIRQLCEVVHSVHDHGIVHRDLKPANVMVIARGGSTFIKLLDLGVARDVKASTKDPNTVSTGTPLYMAPELWAAPDAAGREADIYALGAVTYEILIGKPPFSGTTVMELAKHHARTAPPSLGERFPPQLSAAITRAMSKRASERYATALVFGDALQETSGIATEAFNLPSLDEITRDEILIHAPQPIAEAVARLEAARDPHRAAAALWQVAHIVAKYAGLVALSCRARVSGRLSDSPSVTELLETLAKRSLDTMQWWRLAKELCRPFSTMPELHPVPALIGLYFEGNAELRTPLEALLESKQREPPSTAPPGDVRDFLVGAVPALGAVLRSLRFLQDYPLVVEQDGREESWMGVRRPVRSAISAVRRDAAQSPLLLGPDRVVAVSLWPVMQAAPPSPGSPRELFLLEGRGRGGAKLVADKLEHTDETVWRTLGISGEREADSSVDDEQPPYRGLVTFTQADASLFFGREREVEGFVNRLRTAPFIAVVAPSGTGKSSFVQAGVLPALGDDWRSIVMRPGANPLQNLALQLEAEGIESLATAMRDDPKLLGRALRAATVRDGTSRLLIVDQFEELFTLCFDATEQEAFARSLVEVATDADDPVRVVVTLRDDFLVRAAQLPSLRDRLASTLQLLTIPVKSDLIRILREPARRAGYSFEDQALLDEMVDDVVDQPAALALLSFTAHQLWQFRDRHFKQLPRKAYRALGGVGGALAKHAETTLDGLSESEKGTVREVFRHLTTAEGTRAVMSRSELVQVAKQEAVIEKLIQARLLVAMESPGGERIEVVHEALLTMWPRLVRWRQEDAESARLLDQLRAAARQWNERGRIKSLLWRGEALTEYRIWRARYPGTLTTLDEEFAQSSVADAQRSQRLRRGVLVTVMVGLAIALVIFARLRSVAEENRKVAETSRRRAEASETAVKDQLSKSYFEQGRRALLASDTVAALLYLNEAFQRGVDNEAIRFMLARGLQALGEGNITLHAHDGLLWDVAYSNDGTRIATIGADGDAKIWDVATGALQTTLRGHRRDGFGHVVWGSDATLFTADASGTIRIWRDGNDAGTLVGHTTQITTMAIHDDTLLTGAIDGVRVWDLKTRVTRATMPMREGEGANARWSPSGKVVVVVVNPAGRQEPGWAELWTPATNQRTAFRGHTANLMVATLDPSERWLATTSRDRTARIWDASGRLVHTLPGHDDVVTDAVWSPDSAWLVTAGGDGMIKVWNRETGVIRFGLRGHTGRINRIAYTPDGKLLVSSSADGTLRVWDADRGALVATHAHGGMVIELDVRGDSEQIATASWNGTVKLWSLRRRDLEQTLAGNATLDAMNPNTVLPVLLPDRIHAVFGGTSGGELWNVTNGKMTLLPTDGPAGLPKISADAKSIVLGDETGRVYIFDLTGRRLHTIKASDKAVWYELSPDAKQLITVDQTSFANRWDVTTGERLGSRAGIDATTNRWIRDRVVIAGLQKADASPVHILDPHTFETVRVLSENAPTLVLSRDQKRLALGGASSDIDVWSLDGNGEKRTLHQTAFYNELVWSNDRLLVALSDGRLLVWSAEGTRLAEIDAHDVYISGVGTNASGSLAITTALDGFAKVWDLTTFEQLFQYRVPPGTTFATLVDGDTKLLSSNGMVADLWTATTYRGTPSALATELACRLSSRLEAGFVVSSTPTCK